MLGTRLVVVGADFHFGYRRHGDVPLLQAHGRRARLRGARARPRRVARVGRRARRRRAVLVDPRRASCSRAGDVEGAAAILGRPHEVRGPVEHGDAAGPRARLPDRQRRGARAHLPARRRRVRRHVRRRGRRRATWPRSRSAGARPSTRSRACCCSRPTCSISTATSTASRPGCASAAGCGARSASNRVDDLIAQMAPRRRGGRGPGSGPVAGNARVLW